jgi:hypothetical protein
MLAEISHSIASTAGLNWCTKAEISASSLVEVLGVREVLGRWEDVSKPERPRKESPSFSSILLAMRSYRRLTRHGNPSGVKRALVKGDLAMEGAVEMA